MFYLLGDERHGVLLYYYRRSRNPPSCDPNPLRAYLRTIKRSVLHLLKPQLAVRNSFCPATSRRDLQRDARERGEKRARREKREKEEGEGEGERERERERDERRELVREENESEERERRERRAALERGMNTAERRTNRCISGPAFYLWTAYQ